MSVYLRGTVLAISVLLGAVLTQAQTHVVEVTADKDSRFKIASQSKPEITLKAGEPVLLRITSNKGKTWNRDGSIHGFTLMHAGNRMKVPGWNLALMTGTHEFHLTAPSEPGDYVVVCSVICSEDHENMNMKLVVVP
jgi:heme/copper-type cytochrome/quinol oxidase subunit 2